MRLLALEAARVSLEDTQNPVCRANGKQNRALPNSRLLQFFYEKSDALNRISASPVC
jgi:hypothetical protein